MSSPVSGSDSRIGARFSTVGSMFSVPVADRTIWKNAVWSEPNADQNAMNRPVSYEPSVALQRIRT